jgi:peroxiredoxin
MKFSCLAATLALAGALAVADELPEGHSTHGEEFNEGPRQAAVLMGGTGEVKFPVSTKNAEAQKFFTQGIGQLHGFWFFEAERSFRQVLALDTNCAMAYWGMAMANFNNKKRAVQFAQKSADYRKFAGPREQLYIDGLHKFYSDDGRDQKTKERDYIRSLEKIVQDFPDDVEAKAFLARFIWEYRKNNPISSHQAVDALLDQVFTASPMHPSHHFRIHLWNSEKDERALGSAARCGQSAPSIAHMWHMSGHTYSKLKRYDDAAWQQEASARVDHAHMMRYWVLPDQIHNYAHNNEWLIRDMINVGRVNEALALAKNMIELPRHPKYNTLKKGSANYGRQRLLDTLLAYELWEQLLALSKTPYLPALTDNPSAEAARLRAIGIAHYSLNDVPALEATLAQLEKLPVKTASTNALAKADAPKKKTAPKGVAPKKDAPAKAADSSSDDKKDESAKGDEYASEDKGNDANNDATAVKNAKLELQALVAIKKSDRLGAWRLFDQVKDIPKDRLARYYLAIDAADKAIRSAEDLAKNTGGEVLPLATLVETLYYAGKHDEAAAQFKKLQEISGSIDLSAPIFSRLSDIAEGLGQPRQWKRSAKPRNDVGKRPALDSLGPIHWTGPQAPNWTLPGENGTTISLKDYQGRPVIVMFYLGARCLHCVQQLNAMAPMADPFAQAGISIVAINAGSVADIAATHEKALKDKRFPFPIAADEPNEVFKQWRCFDDFEKMALHGTFLVDGAGKIRWLDISFEPFMDVKFLLEESKRLLGLDRPVQTAATGK